MTDQAIRLALSRYLGIVGGPRLGISEATPEEVRRTALREDLAAMRLENKLWLRVYVGMLVVLFVVILGLAVWQGQESLGRATCVGAAGVSFVWILGSMRRAWRDKWFLDLLSLTVDGLSKDALDQLAFVLLEKLARTGRVREGDVRPATRVASGS